MTGSELEELLSNDDRNVDMQDEREFWPDGAESNDCPNANGRQYGGVGIAPRASKTSFKVFDVPNPEHYEVLCITGKVAGIQDKVAAIAVYIHPNYPRQKAEACLDYISNVVSEVKRALRSPTIIVAGDWNQWPVDYVLQEHPEMIEVEHGPTRGDRKIDRFLTNISRSI